MKRKRIIDQLRRLFPEENFRWSCEEGRWLGRSFEVFGESHNYDEGRGTHMVKYVRSDTYQVVEGIPFRIEKCG